MTNSTPSASDIDAMTDTQIKILENRLRRAARRQGLLLEKSRSRDPRARDYGTYHLVNAATRTIETWGLPGGYGLTLDDVADALEAPTAEPHTTSDAASESPTDHVHEAEELNYLNAVLEAWCKPAKLAGLSVGTRRLMRKSLMTVTRTLDEMDW